MKKVLNVNFFLHAYIHVNLFHNYIYIYIYVIEDICWIPCKIALYFMSGHRNNIFTSENNEFLLQPMKYILRSYTLKYIVL